MADKILLLEGLPWEGYEEYVSMKYDFPITPTTRMIKILTGLLMQGVEGHTHGQLVWKWSPVKSSKQEFSSNVIRRSSAREPNEPITSKNFT